MEQNNISVVINNYFVGGENPLKGQKIYSVIVSHEAEAHENYLFTDREKAIAKMEEVVEKWKNGRKWGGNYEFEIHKYNEEKRVDFTPQYKTKLGYWYNYGEWEYGYVELLECVLE